MLTRKLFFILILFLIATSFCAISKVDPRPYQYGNYYLSKKEILDDAKLKLIIRHAGFKKNDKIADIGSENGYVAAILSMFYENLSFHLEDINPATLNEKEFNKVKTYYEKLGGNVFNSDFKLQIGAQCNTRLTNNFFDHIMLNDVIHQAYFPNKLLDDIRKKLKADGRLMIGQYEHNGISKKNLLFFTNRNGFQLIKKYQESNYNLFIFIKSSNYTEEVLNMHTAAITGNNKVLADYIQSDRNNINLADELGFSPLLYAAKYGHLSSVMLLVKQDADVNFQSNIYPVNALLLAIRNDHYEIVKYLLENDADLNQTFNGKSALMIAAENGNIEIVNLLVIYLANIRYHFEGRDVLYYAVLSGNLDLVKYFFKISKVKVNKKDDEGRTLLSYAATSSNPEIIRYLIEDKNAKKNSTDKWGNKPSDYIWNEDVAKYLHRYPAGL
ncbi:MAG: ankyrin repeat domain-containing protein [Bacteroidetes bacterium]|nr:ankyrin repeat domain-containing protein [Bacteroidota bacterium]